ncbi:hypothetical protein BHE74_00024558 [Ensete ventricosum]|nr:hypothetical protein GW17_00049434 [Ensete ventricosum]RWW67956.1 hypothetical protein BHE74_00024558 [Ensete ventricosum]
MARPTAGAANPQGRPAAPVRGDSCQRPTGGRLSRRHLWSEASPARAARAASKGCTRLRPVRKGAVPMEVPPTRAEPAARAAAPWQSDCQQAR